MSRSARNYSDSGVYHVVFRGINQQTIFEEKADFEKLFTVIKDVKHEMGVSLYAYCFMSNHVHLVLKEKNMMDISLIMKKILTKYARWYNLKYGRSGALIANRYKSVPVEIDDYFLHLIRYVHQNPVRARIVNNVSDYEYSSFGEYVAGKSITDTEFVLGMLSREEFIKFNNEYSEFKFKVSDRTTKSDEEAVLYIAKKFKIDNPKEIAKLGKEERDEILKELKQSFSARQIQRVTGVSRGLISKIEP